eukprot:2683300-Prorocentrum_lima.AAC.1
MKTSLKSWSHPLESNSPWSIHHNLRQDGRHRPSHGVNFVGMITDGGPTPVWGGQGQDISSSTA